MLTAGLAALLTAASIALVLLDITGTDRRARRAVEVPAAVQQPSVSVLVELTPFEPDVPPRLARRVGSAVTLLTLTLVLAGLLGAGIYLGLSSLG